MRPPKGTDPLKAAISEAVQRRVVEAATVLTFGMDALDPGNSVEASASDWLTTMIRVRTPVGVRYFQVRVSESL